MPRKINPELIKAIESKNFYVVDCLAVLFCIDSLQEIPSYVPSQLVYYLDLAGIIKKNSSNNFELVFPLYEEQEKNSTDLKWDWVKEWRDMFKSAYSERAGSTTTCIARMKTFFSENPEVRKEDIFGATMLYLESVQDAKYLTTSHKFIYDGAGKSRNSKLEEWVEKYKEILEASKQTNQSSNVHISDIMR